VSASRPPVLSQDLSLVVLLTCWYVTRPTAMEAPLDSREHSLSRRRFLAGATVAAASGIALGVRAGHASAAPEVPSVPLGSQPAGLPTRQHAWVGTLAVDLLGDPVAPQYDRLLFFDVNGLPSPAYALLLESRLRTLERRYDWSPNGLLFTVSWAPAYFKLLRIPSPVPAATSLSTFENPAIDRYDMCLHLACNDEQRLQDVERALVRGAPLDGVEGSLTLAPALTWRETRTGFTGTGLPAAHQHVRGIPAGSPVPAGSPLFMGFKSALRKNQATEDDVTIPDGPFAQGTTLQVSYMLLNLDEWYDGLSEARRVALMYSPQTSVASVAKITNDAPGEPGKITEAITTYGMIGHAQASATARQHNRPVIIRRDFNTVDGGHAGLHFVSVQRSIQDFVATRNAMNASGAHLVNRTITATANNGINAFITVKRRANYVMPSRTERAFPLLPGRQTVLS